MALARRVTTPAVALLIAGLATAADLISAAAGPTRALVEGVEGGPTLPGQLLSHLLLIFPTFGYPFALGASDFVFLALFAAVAARLNLRRTLPTLAPGCAAVLLAMLAGLLLDRPLPALPFIAASFILATATPMFKHFRAKNGR